MKQGEIWYANLDPAKDSEQAGHRRVVILSGNLLNTHLNSVICCPLTTKVKNYKGNVVLQPNKSNQLQQVSEILTFHIRSLSKNRLSKKIGTISEQELNELKKRLDEILRY